MKILHIITGLNSGGAEGVMSRLCLNDKENTHIVVSLTDYGKHGASLVANGISIECLNLTKNPLSIIGIFRLLAMIKRHKPDVVQTWMYHADLIGGVVAKLAGIKRIFWGIRHSDLEPGTVSPLTLLIARISSILSHYVPTKIVVCAEAAKKPHVEIGYAPSKMVVIQNGFDLDQFKPNQSAGHRFRKDLQIPSTQFLIGHVARFNPQKDHETFLSAVAKLKSSLSEFHCVMIGDNIDTNNSILVSQIESLGLAAYVSLLGPRDDIVAAMNAFDVQIMSSKSGEGFPNIVGEAMACGTPCIATDVGDAAMIVGDCGWVVSKKSSQEMAEVIKAVSSQVNSPDWHQRSTRCIERIGSHFGINRMIHSFNVLWAEEH